MAETVTASFTVMFRPLDFEHTRAFLHDRLGLECVSSWTDDGCGAIFVAGDGRIELFGDEDPAAVAAERPHRPVSTLVSNSLSISWRVDDVDEVLARWGANGVIILSTPQQTPWGTRLAVAQGPDGMRLCPFSDSRAAD